MKWPSEMLKFLSYLMGFCIPNSGKFWSFPLGHFIKHNFIISVELKQSIYIYESFIIVILMFFTALKSHGKSATFRQHYYPEGGWGWVICFCCFLVNIFTTGLQLSFSILYLKILQHCESEVGPEDKISIGKYLHTLFKY